MEKSEKNQEKPNLIRGVRESFQRHVGCSVVLWDQIFAHKVVRSTLLKLLTPGGLKGKVQIFHF